MEGKHGHAVYCREISCPYSLCHWVHHKSRKKQHVWTLVRSCPWTVSVLELWHWKVHATECVLYKPIDLLSESLCGKLDNIKWIDTAFWHKKICREKSQLHYSFAILRSRVMTGQVQDTPVCKEVSRLSISEMSSYHLQYSTICSHSLWSYYARIALLREVILQMELKGWTPQETQNRLQSHSQVGSRTVILLLELEGC